MKKIIMSFLILLSVLMVFNCATEVESDSSNDKEFDQCKLAFPVLSSGVVSVYTQGMEGKTSIDVSAADMKPALIDGAIHGEATKKGENVCEFTVEFKNLKGDVAQDTALILNGNITKGNYEKTSDGWIASFSGSVQVTGAQEFEYSFEYVITMTSTSMVTEAKKLVKNGKTGSYKTTKTFTK